MQAAFIVTLNLTDLSDLSGIAEDISGDLSDTGLSVISVAPWKHPALDGGGSPTEDTTDSPTPSVFSSPVASPADNSFNPTPNFGF